MPNFTKTACYLTNEKNYILDDVTAAIKLRRMAYEILEDHTETTHLVLAGIRESGSVIARCIQQYLSEISNVETELITVTLDKKLPEEVTLSKDMDFNNKTVVLIDDVANSGKTMLYALKPFLQYHPKEIRMLVLVERSHTLFPVKPDYVGVSIATTLQEHIFVEVNANGVLGAYLK